MKKSLPALWVMLFVITMVLSGCILPPFPSGDGGEHRGRHDRGHGDRGGPGGHR